METSDNTPDSSRAETVESIEACIDKVLNADDVQEATARLELLLEQSAAEVTSVGTDHDDSHGRKKIVLGDVDLLFLKTLRNSGNDSVLDLFCELVGYRIAEQFGAPVATASLVDLDELGPALVMRYLTDDCRGNDNDPTDFANADDLPRLYAVELWIQNYDDKERHFMLTDDSNGQEVRYIDHGHSLYRNWLNNIDEPADVETFEPSNKAGEKPHLYRVNRVEDVSEQLSRIQEITDEQCAGLVSWALDQLEKTDHPKVREFLIDMDFHREATVRLLKKRRDEIYDLADDRLS